MAWPDGSRFLIASGVKWGSGPKVYKGSKRDTPWNKDLLWKLYVEQEARKMNLPLRKDEHDDNVEAYPPYMKSLACATHNNAEPLKLWDPYRHDQFKTGTVLTEREANWKDLVGPHGLPLIHRGSPRTWSARRHDMGEEKMQLDTMKLNAQLAQHGGGSGGGGGGHGATAARPETETRKSARSAGGASTARRSVVSAGAGSARSARTTSSTLRRLEALEASLKSEHTESASLRRDLEKQKAEKAKLDRKMAAYDTIMKGLMEAMNKSGAKLPSDMKLPVSER